MAQTGLLESISSKEINTKYGPKKKYSVKIDGVWYDAGWKKPTAVEGTHVSFDSKTTSYGKEIDGGLTPAVAGLGAGTSVATKAPAASRGKYEAAPFPVPPLDPSRSIIRQNALRHATGTVAMVPGMAPTLDEAVSMVIYAARKYEEYISGYDTVNELEKEAKDA